MRDRDALRTVAARVQVYHEVVSAVEDAVFVGGARTDVISDLGITGGKKKDIKEFESLLP